LFIQLSSDSGNFKLKVVLDKTTQVTLPSVIKQEFKKPIVDEGSIATKVEQLYKNLTVNITSPGIKRDGMYSIGERANHDATKAKNMDITLGNKHLHDIPVIANLAIIAVHAVQKEFKNKNQLPATIAVESSIAASIPASEWTKENAAHLEQRFTGKPESPSTHVVIVYVGDQQVTVTIKITKAKVTQEGVPALYALVSAPDDILRDFLKLYNDNPTISKMKPKDFATKKGILVDIGSGTVEFIHTRGMNPVTANCRGAKHGVGHAAEQAATMLKEELNGKLDINRQRFDEIYQDKNNNYYDLATQFMAEAQYNEAESILTETQKMYSNIGGDADFIMVFGGGSITFKPDMYNEILEFTKQTRLMLLWIPEDYAIDLNRHGLDILHQKVFFKEGA